MNEKIYNAVISGKSDNNIKYRDFQNLIESLGFEFKRQKGSHATYKNYSINERMNIQAEGNKAKSYQVKQLREIILEYDL
ncbi:MAG: type II toxin-antitoxin system HicA family toxin [Lachnospiraceae bacterium]|nr:type II toxin-antitoxin system HicA family toxin [Lachnospiraceae bacterium]